MSEITWHVSAFVDHNLCFVPRNRNGSAEGHLFLHGQMHEVESKIYNLNCQTCQLLMNVMHANKLTPLFNSNQFELARALKEALK